MSQSEDIENYYYHYYTYYNIYLYILMNRY